MMIYTIKPALKTTLSIKTTSLQRPHGTGSQKYTFHFIAREYKDHLCIRTRLCWSLGWSLYTSFTVFTIWCSHSSQLLVNTMAIINAFPWSMCYTWCTLCVYGVYMVHVYNMFRWCKYHLFVHRVYL